MNQKIAFAFAALLLLPGCAESEPPRPSEQSNPVDGTSAPSRPDPEAPFPPANQTASVRGASALAGTDCVQTGVTNLGVAGIYGETAPTGWEPSGLPLTKVSEFLLQCSRVSWGPLERPSFVLWDLHEGFSVPDTCKTAGDFNYILGTVWFSDEFLVNRALAFGMPAHFGQFSLDRQDLQGIESWDWRWSVPGGEESRLMFFDNPPDLAYSGSFPTRYFWFNGTGVSYFEHDVVELRNQASLPVAAGTLAAPMFYANGGSPAYVGTAGVSREAHFTGTIHEFRDLECKQPILP